MSKSSAVHGNYPTYDEYTRVHYNSYCEFKLHAYFIGAASDGIADEAFDAGEPHDSAYEFTDSFACEFEHGCT